MQQPVPFGEILEAADELPVEDQESLIAILKSRLRERLRAELAKDIQEAGKEFEKGGCRPITPDELMREILS
ncbi:MAG: hypothetical protein HY648_05390 [Acidobacteria bacterium]|nr:hypothetical protein [Acidobacteriota bacterium]